MMRAIRYTAWILCVLIVSVSLDAIPDPPAIRSSYKIEAEAKLISQQADGFALHRSAPNPLAWSAGRWRAIHRHSTVHRSDDRFAAVWRFADTSPPFVMI